MMLDHIGEQKIASKIRKAIAKVVEEGKVRSYDMMKLRGGSDAIKKGAATTQQITDAVLAEF
jgi:3-isopropylmalate dehydrogenase